MNEAAKSRYLIRGGRIYDHDGDVHQPQTADLLIHGETIERIAPAIAAQLEVDARYAHYVDRQEADVVAFRKDEGIAIPLDFDFASIAGLSAEVRQKLDALRPATLAQASRMEGMTPAALMRLLAHLRKPPARRTA